MKIDLSKVTFSSSSACASLNDEVMIYEFENVKITSNRQHTLLYQSARKFVSSGNSGNISEAPQMSKLTFLNVFDSHKPEEIEKLDRLFLECKGTLPSRRQLSAIAQSIGIQQSKIKKWFDKRNMEQNPVIIEHRNVPSSDESDEIWNELNAKLDQIDNEIHVIESKMIVHKQK